MATIISHDVYIGTTHGNIVSYLSSEFLELVRCMYCDKMFRQMVVKSVMTLEFYHEISDVLVANKCKEVLNHIDRK